MDRVLDTVSPQRGIDKASVHTVQTCACCCGGDKASDCGVVSREDVAL